MTALLTALRAAVGEEHVLCPAAVAGVGHNTAADSDLAAYEQDWRGRARGQALAVVRPANTQQVAAVLRLCAAAGVSVVPQGGNTGLVLGSTPDNSGQQVVLSLKRLNRVRALDPANLTLTVEAGCVLQAVQQAAHEAKLLFPLSLAAEGSCTIGGNLATNAGGTQVLRYGNARELCLGLEVVNAQGEIWDGLSGLRKDNTGYDLRDLFIGSEGTLGVITAATLKLFPQPASELTAWLTVADLDAALALLKLARSHLGAALTGFEVMGERALALVSKHESHLRVPPLQGAGFAVLLEYAGDAPAANAQAQMEIFLQAALSEGCVGDAIVAQSLTQAREFWQVREHIPLAQAREGANIKHDIALPISAIPAFCRETEQLIAAALPGATVINFGHLGDGNLHYNIQAPPGVVGSAFVSDNEAQANEWVYQQVQRFGGSISAEHGIGALKCHTLPRYKSALALQMMRAIKQALDPQGILNPGRVLSYSKHN